MSTATPPDGHVVHLLQHWGDSLAPVSLRTRPKLSPTSRVILAVLLVMTALVAVYLVVTLWTLETPGWWFSLLFTVIILGLTFGLWFGFVEALRSGARREQASSRWTEIREAVSSSPGVLVSRNVVTSEDGTVPRFDVTVRTADGSLVTAIWNPQSSSRYLLQSQVPGVGSTVRVWRNESGPDLDPLVIEVLDPTVLGGADGTGVSQYAD